MVTCICFLHLDKYYMKLYSKFQSDWKTQLFLCSPSSKKIYFKRFQLTLESACCILGIS